MKWNDNDTESRVSVLELWRADEEPPPFEDDIDDDEPAPERAWSEGVSIGANNEEASDKADSEVSESGKPFKSLFLWNSAPRNLLSAVVVFAVSKGEYESSHMIEEIMAMTDGRAIQLNADETLKPKLDDAHDLVMAYFASIWQRVMDMAAQ